LSPKFTIDELVDGNTHQRDKKTNLQLFQNFYVNVRENSKHSL